MKRIFFPVIFIFFVHHLPAQALKLVEHKVQLKKKLAFRLKIPQGYNISVAAEGLERPRFFAISPDGRLFITDMHDRSDNKRIYPDEQFRDSVQGSHVKKPPVAPWGFKAHSAPLGFDYFSGFTDPQFNNSFLVALHGSTSVWRQRGNTVVQMMPGGSYREVITGFLQGKTENRRFGRPCDIIKWNDYSFFVSDDKNGVIYYIWKE